MILSRPLTYGFHVGKIMAHKIFRNKFKNYTIVIFVVLQPTCMAGKTRGPPDTDATLVDPGSCHIKN